jgi:nucleotide-binding universal stress UspA family protein
MKILVPTDFSPSSQVAIVYAAKIARQFNANLTLLHVNNSESPFPPRTNFKSAKVAEMIDAAALEEITLLRKSITKSTRGLNVETELINGLIADDMIVAYSKKRKFDLIVMGTKGAGAVKKVLLGSNAAGVIAQSNIPVIVIPENAVYTKIKKIVYASDFVNLKSEVKIPILFAKLLSSSLDILHVVSPKSKHPETEKLNTQLIEKNNYEKISIHVVEGDDIPKTIDKYINQSKPGLLALHTHKPTLYEKLFGKSVTRELAFHSNIPLLTLKR